MPRAGGEADKLGGYYEGLWIAANMLELLREEDGALCIEPPGAASEGIEFWRDRGGIREAHQVKRQWNFHGAWTLGELRRRDVLDTWRARLADPNAEAHFISSINIDVLCELVSRARSSPDSLTFRDEYLAAKQGREALESFKTLWPSLADGDAWQILRRIRIHALSEDDLEARVAAESALFFDENAEVVAGALMSFAVKKLGHELRAHDVWAGLRERKITPRPAHDRASLSMALEGRTRQYLDEGDTIPGHRLPRPEADGIVHALQGDVRVAWIVGEAGSGKSEVARDVVARLREAWPVLALRVDRLEAATTPQQVGEQLGLKLGPVEAVAAAAQRGDALLLVDQLDAISVVSGRRAALFDAVRAIVDAARQHPRLRVVVACRKFDLDNDHRLREWKRKRDEANTQVCTWAICALPPGVVRGVVAALGASVLSDDQIRILTLPLHLRLFADIVAQGRVFSAFSTPTELFEQFVRRKRDDISIRGLPDQWDAVVPRLVRRMTDEQSLWTPSPIHDPYVRAMESEHVLVRDGSRVSFFHEGLFDYLFALHFDGPLLDWLQNREQALFQRAPIRQVLAYRRDSQPRQYQRDLEGLLLPEGVRFHVQHLVLHLLGRLADPREGEARILRAYLARADQRRARHALHATRGSLPWFGHLQMSLRQMLDGADDVPRREALRWLMPLVDKDPGTIVKFLRPYLDRGTEWTSLLAWFVLWCHDYTGSPEFVALVVALVERGAFDEAAGPRDLWSTLAYGSPPEWPGAAAIASALLRRELGMPAAKSPRSHAGAKVLKSLAAGDAGGFNSSFLPILLDACGRASEADPETGLLLDRFDHVLADPADADASSALSTGVIDATVALVRAEDARGEAALLALCRVPARGAQIMVARILAELGPLRADAAIEWLREDSRRLDLNHLFAGSYTEELVRAVAPHCSIELLARLESLIANQATLRRRRGGARFQWRLLSAVPEGRLAEETRRRFARLKRRFGVAKRVRFEGPMVYGLVSPIATEDARVMSDEDWLAAMVKYDDDRHHWDSDDRLKGGASELARELQARAAEDPVRFAGLAGRLPDDANAAYARALLGGLGAGGLDVGIFEQVIERMHRLPERPVGREIVDLVKKHAELPWSPTILAVVAWYATESPDPGDQLWNHGRTLAESVWTTGVNSVRGSAAECLGVLAEVDRRRIAALLPAMRSVVRDAAPAVRACAAVTCLGVIRHDPELAFALAATLFQMGGSALAASPVERLLRFLLRSHAERLLPTLERLTASELPEVAAVGARQVTLAGLDDPHARALAEKCLTSAAHLREAVATVLAANVRNPQCRAFCESRLASLFEDEDATVRKAACATFRSHEDVDVSDLHELAVAFVKSPAFADDMDGLILLMEKSRGDCSEIIILAAERFLDIAGEDAGNMQTHAAFTAHHTRMLIARAYGQTEPESELRRRCLDVIDRMFLYGVRETEAAMEVAGR